MVTRHIGHNRRPIKVPTWACTKGAAFSPECAPVKQRFRAMTPAAKATIRNAACEDMAAELKSLKRQQAMLENSKQDMAKQHDLTVKEIERKTTVKLEQAQAAIDTLKSTIATGAPRKTQRLREQLSLERAEKKKAVNLVGKIKKETKYKLQKNEAKLAEARKTANRAVNKKCKAVKMKGELKLKLKEKNAALKNLKEDTFNLLMDAKLILRTSERGRPYTDKMESHARALMSTGSSAASARQQFMLDAKFFLSAKQFSALEFPEERWFNRQREAMGLESWIHAHLKLAKADFVRQFGFDETEINGVSTMNQWVLIETGGELEMITLEAGGVLSGGTSEESIAHFRKTWERGQEAVALVREALGKDADRLAPLVEGGGEFHKIDMTMHDTVLPLTPHLFPINHPGMEGGYTY